MSGDESVTRTPDAREREGDADRDDRSVGSPEAGSATGSTAGLSAEPTDGTVEPTDGTAGSPDGTVGSTDGTTDEPGSALTPRFLIALRENRRRRAIVLPAATVLGVALAWVHWLGLFVAGGLVGLASTSLSRALFAGLVVGVLVLVLNVLVVPAMDAGEFAGLRPASYLTIAAGLIAPLWGSLVCGVL
jgi:hypothetical protein